jgi:hypothetical protein
MGPQRREASKYHAEHITPQAEEGIGWAGVFVPVVEVMPMALSFSTMASFKSC